VSQPAARQPATEPVSFAISPADDANSKFFFGSVTEATDIAPNDRSARSPWCGTSECPGAAPKIWDPVKVRDLSAL
jgi:hypothetical protein